MDSPKDFRENAEECLGWARTARTVKERDIFLQIARAWREAADRCETPSAIIRPEDEDRQLVK
jgi:hypothetical protein